MCVCVCDALKSYNQIKRQHICFTFHCISLHFISFSAVDQCECPTFHQFLYRWYFNIILSLAALFYLSSFLSMNGMVSNQKHGERITWRNAIRETNDNSSCHHCVVNSNKQKIPENFMTKKKLTEILDKNLLDNATKKKKTSRLAIEQCNRGYLQKGNKTP